jgi:hypothetical protein
MLSHAFARLRFGVRHFCAAFGERGGPSQSAEEPAHSKTFGSPAGFFRIREILLCSCVISHCIITA